MITRPFIFLRRQCVFLMFWGGLLGGPLIALGYWRQDWLRAVRALFARQIDGEAADADAEARSAEDLLPLVRPGEHCPTTQRQNDANNRSFIESIQPSAVCELVSRCNGGNKTCEVMSQKNGSYNVCFFVRVEELDETQVVRIPIVPALRHIWQKVVSEATTTRYIREKTTIPVPDILTYGTDGNIVPGANTVFMIMKLVRGRPLDTKTYLKATATQRHQLHTDLLDVLCQMRQLQFSSGGSLMPVDLCPASGREDVNNNSGTVVVGPFLSTGASQFEIDNGELIPPQTFASAAEFVQYHLRLLTGMYSRPAGFWSLEAIKKDWFHMHHVLKEAPVHLGLDSSSSPADTDKDLFVLAHPDLRIGNIMIDDDFSILGVLDWEYASTLPVQLNAPPSWLTGLDPAIQSLTGWMQGVPRAHEILGEFRAVVALRRETCPIAKTLWEEWHLEDALQTSPVNLALVQILFHPTSLSEVYTTHLSTVFHGPLGVSDQNILDYFDRRENAALAKQVELLADWDRRYTIYCQAKGFLATEEERRQRDEKIERDWSIIRKMRDERRQQEARFEQDMAQLRQDRGDR